MSLNLSFNNNIDLQRKRFLVPQIKENPRFCNEILINSATLLNSRIKSLNNRMRS